MTTLIHNAGGDVAVDLNFFGPPETADALGAPFDLTEWEVRIYDPSAQILGKEIISYTDRVAGKVRVIFEGTSDLGSSAATFRVQIVRASGPTPNGFSVGFPVTRIRVGDFNTEDFGAEPPVQQLSGKSGVQMTVARAEPEIIYGYIPWPTITSAPQITGYPVAGSPITIVEGIYSGSPAPTLTPTLTLGGVDVTANLSGLDYTIPEEVSVGEVLEYSETASNGMSPDAQGSVSVTVQDGVFTPASLFASGQQGLLFEPER